MTWLARIYLDYETVARLRIRDSYDWHKKAWEIFPGRPKGHPRPFLFRVIEKNEGCDFLLMCHEEPTKPDWVESDGWKVSPVGEGFPFHRNYRFDLLANPTQRDKARDTWNGREAKRRRFNLSTFEEHKGWLLRKAAQHGFELPNDTEHEPLIDSDPRRDYPFLYRDKSRGLHVGVRYQGVLKVVDQKKFAVAFKQGMGSAKSFGFGLLLLTPIMTMNKGGI